MPSRMPYAAGGGSLSPRSASVCKAEGPRISCLQSGLFLSEPSLWPGPSPRTGKRISDARDEGPQSASGTVFVSRRDRERAITPAPNRGKSRVFRGDGELGVSAGLHRTVMSAWSAPLPGVGPWDEIVRSRALWHFSFQGPDAERLVAGSERIYLDRFRNEFSADPRSFTEASREHYAKLYALPGAMHAGFNQFAAFDQDAIDNKAFVSTRKLTMPVLAVGGEKSFRPT